MTADLPKELPCPLGGKGIHVVRNRRPLSIDRPDDLDNVEAGRTALEQSVRFEKRIRRPRHPLAAQSVDSGTAGRTASALRRVFTSTNTTVRPSTAMMSSLAVAIACGG
jgi:hypothetical protein